MKTKFLLLFLLLAAIAKGSTALQLDPNQSSIITSIVVNTSSIWRKVSTDLPEHTSYRFTMESMVQTGGVRYFVYKDYVFNVGSTDDMTNTVFYSPYTQDLRKNPDIITLKPDVPLPISELLDKLPGISKDIKLPEIKKRPDYDYVDYVDYNSLITQPYTNQSLLAALGINDPWEGFNRIMFTVDETLFVYFIGPAGKVYKFITPKYFRTHLTQLDYNLLVPKRIFNNLLQGKFKGTGITCTRFLINTTAGVAGFWDPATAIFNLEKYDEDTGQTFAKWGIPPGVHIYFPVLAGNTSVRDGVGIIFDEALDPRTYAPFGGAAKAFMELNNLSHKIDKIDMARRSFYDPYSLQRDLWYIMRTHSIDN